MPKDTDIPAFLFYPDDFTSDGKVEAMTTEEVGAYILLLCKAWRESPVGSIPADDAVLARWTRQTPARWAECKPKVLAAFKLGTDSRWHQRRMRNDHKKLMAKRKKRVNAAIAGALAKWGNGPPKPPPDDAIRIPSASQSTIGDGNGNNPSLETQRRETDGKPRSRFMPSSEQEAVEWASMAGVPADFAKEVFHQIEGRGGVDGSGQPVTNWRSHIAYRWSRQRHEWKPDGKKPERAMTPHDIKTIIAAKEAIANELKAKFSSEVAMGVTWDNEVKRDEWRVIKREIKELTVRLSQMV